MGLKKNLYLYYFGLIFLILVFNRCSFIQYHGKLKNFAQSCDSSVKNHPLLKLGGGYELKNKYGHNYVFFYSDFSCKFTGYYNCEDFADFERQSRESDYSRRIRDGQLLALFGFYRVSNDSVFVQRKIQYRPLWPHQSEETLFILRGDTLIWQNRRTISGVRGWFNRPIVEENPNLEFIFIPTNYKPDSLAAFKTGEEGRYTRALKRKFCKE